MDLEVLVSKFSGEEMSTPQQTVPSAYVLLEYAQQIQNFFSGSPDPSKIDYYLGLAFPHSKTEGLLGYLERKITDKTNDKAKEAVFQLIEFILVQRAWKVDVDRFCIGFKKTADMYWKHSREAARIQQAALDCLICLFENFGTSLDLIEFEASQLYVELLSRSEKTSYQPTVRGKMFHLMGILGSLGHDSFMKQDGWFVQLFNHVTSTVKSQVESGDSHLEVSILHGCLKALNSLLNVFSTEVNVDHASWLKFQEHLEQLIDPATSIDKVSGRSKIKRREFQRAALEVVANHSSLIQVGLFKKYRQWFNDLIRWSISSNADDNRIGRRAMYKFLETVMVEYPAQFKEIADNRHQAELEAFYRFFAEKFRSVLNTKHANKIELEIAVRGFGMLSNLCTDQQGAYEMLDLIMDHINNINHELESPVVDKYNSSISVVSTYLDSVASILPSLKSGDGSSNLPETHMESMKKLAILLVRFFPDLSENKRYYAHISVQRVFDSLWDHHHSLCEPFIEHVYQQSLLYIVSSPTRAEVDILIESWNKTHPESKKSAQSQLGLKPVSFYTQFWKFLLSRSEISSHILRFDLMMQWILTTIGKLDLSMTLENSDLSESNLDPVQGAKAEVIKDFQIFINIVDLYSELMSTGYLHKKFYKWIVPFTTAMLGYINKHPFVSGFYKILAVVFDSARKSRYFEEETNLERRNLHETLNSFFQGLGTRIREFRDDLLFAVLELWLCLPDTLILTNFTALKHTLRTVFTTGRNSFNLAIKGLEAIERWFFQKEFPVDEITAIMNSIFPILKTYFITSELSTQPEIVNAGTENVKANMKTRIKKRVQTSKPVEDATLKATQVKILQIIGSFGQFIQINEKEHSGLSKDQRFLKYDVPFQDCKPHFHIDNLLPRVLELCEDAVERQTRISACEFFHTITLYFIGISPSREDEKEKLFRRIFKAVMKLGCDSDIVVRQLFNPLCIQMIHWFSKPHSPYGVALMEVLTEDLTQHDDSSLRELAALCIGEYFQWCIRHGDTGIKAKGVLKSIFALSTHASPYYRQGSVMAFNSIYRDFREDTNIVSEFSFNLLYSFLTSLKMSKNLPDDSILITSTKQAIKHLERMLKKYKDRFNAALPRQFRPTANNSGKACLQDVVDWMLSESGSGAKVYREECIRLVEVLCPITRGVGSVNQFLIKWEDNKSIDGWIRIAEGKTQLDTLTFLDASSSFYEFLFNHGMLSKAIFSRKLGSSFFEKLITACSVDHLSVSDVDKERLLIVISRLKFAWEVLECEPLERVWIYSIELSKVLASLDRLEILTKLIEVWCHRPLTPSAKIRLGSVLSFEPVEDVNVLSEDQRVHLLKETSWYRAIAEEGFISRLSTTIDTRPLANKIWDTILNTIFKQKMEYTADSLGWEASCLSANAEKIVEHYMITALRLGVDEKTVVDAAFDPTNVLHRDGSFQLVTTKGEIFQKVLLRTLVYCKEFFKFDELLKERAIKDVGDFIQRLLGLIKSDKILRRNQFGESIFQQTLSNWRMISVNCDVATCMKIFAGMLAVDINKCRKSEELSRWYNGPNLMQARHLDLKQKAEVFGYITVFVESTPYLQNKKIIDAIVTTITHVVDTAFQTEQKWIDVEQYVTHIYRKILKVFELIPTNSGLLKPLLLAIHKISEWLKDKPDHLLFRTTRDVFEKAVKVHCQTEGERIGLVSHMYELFTSEDYEILIESPMIWKTCLLPAVSFLSSTATKNFFKKHIYSILTKMEVTPGTIYQWKAKTLGINLLELMIYQTHEDFIKGRELLDAYLGCASPDEIQELERKGDVDRTMYRQITAMSVFGISRSENMPIDNDVLRQCMLTCHESCYNTVVALLLVTNAEFKFFEGFLIPQKLIFHKLVDDRLVFEFPMFIDEANHKSGIVLHRHKANASTNGLGDGDINFLPTSGNLTGSSLAPEATSYDFTTSVTVANSEYYQRIFANPALDVNNATNQENAVVDKLEWNEINQHGCMFAFVTTLKRLRQYHRENPETPHKWPTYFAKFLSDPNVHKNVKTFLVGAIINTPESLEPFAVFLVEPIVKLILNDCFGAIKLNHFVQDVIITLLSWPKTAKPNDELVTRLLSYILVAVQTDQIKDRKDVLNHTLEILQNVVRHWVIGAENGAVIPWTEISAIGPRDPTEEGCSLRLNICFNVLMGRQFPSHGKEVFMKMLVKSLSSRYKAVYIIAAKCIGLLLRIGYQDQESPEHAEVTSAVTTKLVNMSRIKPSNFVENLTAVQSHFPEIMTRVREAIMELCQFPKVRPELLSLFPLLLKQQLAELDTSISITPSSVNCVDNFFTDIDGRGVLQQPCKTDNELVAGLDIFELLIQHCGQVLKILKVVDWLISAENFSESKIRTKFATCLTKLYDRLLDHSVQTDLPIDVGVKKSFLKIFVRMYSDENEEVHQAVNLFWSKVLYEWNQSAELMLEIFDLIGHEEHPLNVLIGLMLQRCSLSPDYSKNIFQEPLDNIQFVPFQLDTSWRLRHSTFQPLFAESLSSVQNFSTLPRAIQSSLFSQRRSVGKFGMNVLRATLANLAFTPTQQQMSGDSMEVQRMEVDYDSFEFENSKSASGNGSSNNASDNQRESPSSLEYPILKLRKKFYARKDASFYEHKVSEKRTEKVEEVRDLQRSRVSGVKTVRSYRIGELPDILISNSDLLNTLLKLAKQDENVARQFLALLFQGMIQEIQSEPKKCRKLLSKAKDIFDRVFRNIIGVGPPDISLSNLIIELAISNNISLPTSVTLDVCKPCNLQKLGILKLEGDILEVDVENPSSKRARPAIHTQYGEDLWLGLAEMYKEIEEYDVLRNIFSHVENVAKNEFRKSIYQNIGEALHLEGMGYLEKAVEAYDVVLDESGEDIISTTGKMFLEDSLMNCLASLGKWDTLFTVTTKFSPFTCDDIFHNRAIGERFIPKQMLSGMQLSLRHDGEEEIQAITDFNKFLQTSLSTEEGTNFMSTAYPFDVCAWLLLVSEEEYAAQANLMLEKGYETVLRQVKNMDSLPLKMQRQIVVSLQQSSVLHDFFKWRKHGQTYAALEGPTHSLLGNWDKLVMHQPMDLLGSNLVSSHRDNFISKVGITLQELGAKDEMLLKIQERRVDQELWLANLGALHKNFSIAQAALARIKETGRDDIRPVEFRKSMAVILTSFAKLLPPEDWCKRWCSVWRKLDKVDTGNVGSIKVDLLLCLAESAGEGRVETANCASIFRALGVDASSETLSSCLLKMAESFIPPSTLQNTSSQGPSLYRQLFYLFKRLTDAFSDADDGVREKMLCCLLRGCSEQGDADEMLSLSNIFSLLKKYPELNKAFDEMVRNVPPFFFLPWIDQIMTAHKSCSKEYSPFSNLIARLVKEFPHAFILQYPEYFDKKYKLFGTALKAVVLPFKLHENTVLDILHEKDQKKRMGMLKKFQDTLQEIINGADKLYGEYHMEYATEMFEIVNGLLSEGLRSSQSSDSAGSQNELSSQSWESAKEDMRKIAASHAKKGREKVIQLDKLSPFLSNFHFFDQESVESPGLYGDFKRPKINENPLIVSFHPTVLVYDSLTRPIRLTILTNDGRRRNFLAKLGDDLRQDRRIQQLFKMSNVLFRKDVSLRKKNLSLETYACIPITEDFGIIEMIDNVMSLREVIFDTPDLVTKRVSLTKAYDKWIKDACTSERLSAQSYDHYRISAKIVSRERFVQVYDDTVGKLPKYMLRDQIRKRSANLHEYFSIRQSMITSYGAMCMVHWLLGIGDRHLENCLLSMRTGNLVGIDFGRAFGTSNYVIPIPELVPFRLTPQLQHLMLPYSYKGLFRESCIQSWNCLTNSSDLILTIADVFIQEPTMDWLKLRQRSKSKPQDEQTEENEMTQHRLENESESIANLDFPFEILKRKLRCHNPTDLLVKELKMHSKKDVPAVYCKIAEGERIFREKDVASSEEYVDILLDLATDKNVLSRIFCGWNSWV